jgi:D-serine deaminase-like pyridoxal phosphate-dependent protein
VPTLHELPTPALVVDLDRLQNNIDAMAKRARDLGVRLRPHVKTHKCIEIGRAQVAAGASGITVSTLYEARRFAEAGFTDITWAFPVIPGRIEEIAELRRTTDLGVVVDSQEAVALLAAAAAGGRTWIKVDCGYHRAGREPDDPALPEIAAAIERAGLEFAGLLSHSGDAYEERGADARAEVAERERSQIIRAAERLRGAGFAVPELSVGSTPGMTAVRDLQGVTEARPGNYVYFDRTQLQLGACDLADCALSVVSTVVSRANDHSICDAGALALSKDTAPGDPFYGAVWADYESNVLDAALHLTSLSQEHGRLSEARPVGERLRILPNHSCLAAACFTTIHGIRGARVETSWRVWNGRD